MWPVRGTVATFIIPEKSSGSLILSTIQKIEINFFRMIADSCKSIEPNFLYTENLIDFKFYVSRIYKLYLNYISADSFGTIIVELQSSSSKNNFNGSSHSDAPLISMVL